MRERAVLLHNIRSAHNVGSIFRTCDGAGVGRVFLTGYTSTPRDRFDRPQKDIAKTALGAEISIPWEYAKDPLTVIERLKREGWLIAAVEIDEKAQDYRAFRTPKPTLFIFGNEVKGISRELLDRSDAVLQIPMRGSKESLNVSVAAGIVLFGTSD